jgi:hypothetical protein
MFGDFVDRIYTIELEKLDTTDTDTDTDKTHPSNIANMLSIKNSGMLKISVSENFLVESEWCFTKLRKRKSWTIIGLFYVPLEFQPKMKN